MLGKKQYQEKLYTNFQLSQRIPKDNFYRRLMDFVNLRLDILYFINYDIDEDLPWHSTISRTRKLLPKSLFEEVFNRILSICVETGMVSGRTQAIDSAYIKANASLDSIEAKQPVQSLEDHINKTYQENQEDTPKRKAKYDKSSQEQRTIQADKNRLRDIKTEQKRFAKKQGGPKGSKNIRARYLSNQTHYSPVDPDARIAVKTGKPRQLCYLSNLSVDTANHVITNIQANHADRKDSRYLIDIVRNTNQRLRKNDLKLERILADAGYSSGENYKYLEDINVVGYIPLHGQYEGTREGFEYEPEQDRWKCRNGKYVTFRKIKYQKDQPEKHYLTTRSDCKGCPYAKECLGKSKEKRIRITLYKQEYDRAKERVESKKGRIMKKKRQSTVEPVFGTLIDYMGMRKIGVRGLEQANKVMLMAGAAYNLKKLMHHMQKSTKTAALKIKQTAIYYSLLFSNSFFLLFKVILTHYLKTNEHKSTLLAIT